MSSDANTRSARLSKFFWSVQHGKHMVSTATHARHLFQAICDQENRPACVEKLVASQPALNALQHGLRLDISLAFIDENITPFIHYLSEPTIKQLCHGQLLQDILVLFVEPPTLWKVLVASYKARILAETSLRAFAWLLLELLLLSTDSHPNILEDAQTVDADGFLLKSASHDIRSLGHKIRHTLLVRTSSTTANSENTPGGRHDNDFEDFRQIAIFPTADELLATEEPFYRRAHEVFEMDAHRRVAVHLDNQFRLLREDMVHELRDDLKIATGQKRGRRSPLVLRDLSIVGIWCGDFKKWRPCSLAVRCKSGLKQLTNLPPAQRKEFLDHNKQFLKHQAFGCLLRGGDVIAFATVERDLYSLTLPDPVIILQVSGDDAFKRTLVSFKLYQNVEFLLVETPTFAYEPILTCLQEKKDLPLAEELLNYDSQRELSQSATIDDSILQSLKECGTDNLQHTLQTACAIKLDPSQLESLLAGLTQSLSLIQGPPGTGKSFIGALLAKAFHAFTSETILVMCYTNHALDQFLEDFLKIGIPQDAIVRLGSKSTDITASLSLWKQKATYKRSQDGWNLMNRLNAEACQFQGSLKEAFSLYHNLNVSNKDILEFLEFEDSTFYEAFIIPHEENDMVTVDRYGKGIKPDYLYQRWSDGKDGGVFGNEASQASTVWQMNYPARQDKIQTWTQKLLEERIANVYNHVLSFNGCQRRLDKILGEKTQAILRGRRIIGCTTTYAAMFAQNLRTISPGVILLEEAGEILESHVLTAMSSDTKHLVLIGDHKQLRPKVNNYALTVEKDDGFDLNRSLFERLVLAGYPHTILTMQHRMAPEISTLVKHLTYPDLLDDEKTLSRPLPRGLQDRVIFFDHTNPEGNFADIADRRDEGVSSSKRNPFEAEMVLNIIRYLGQQGYGTDKLVVLTPYLGQLFLLRDLLKKENDPILNDLDSYDLVRAGLLSPASANYSRRPIRLSTIDNYQGEESDVIIVSLTRSNASNDIGFMASPQRLNVMLSRARNALIMIGNSRTFRKSRKGKEAWIPFLDLLNEKGHIYDGLPVKCEQHPQTMTVVKMKEDFKRECPDGGCPAPCGIKLNCGIHECPSRCHQLSDHSKMKCNKFVEWTCPRQHTSTRICFQLNPSCGPCQRDDLAKERKRQRGLKLDVERERRRREYAGQLLRVQDEIEHQQDIIKSKTENEQRQKILEQHQQDLADLKDTVRNLNTPRLNKDRVVPPTSHVSQRSDEKSRTSNGTGLKTSSHEEAGQKATEERLPGSGSNERSNVTSSATKADWEYQKEFEGANDESIDSLMEMIGLEEVKEKFLSIKASIDTAIRQNIDMKDKRFGAVLLGNPGTGKTTVARLYAKFLTSIGVIPGKTFVDTTASRLAHGGVSECQKLIDKILNGGGGVLFIDEAYQLASGQSPGGTQVLDFLLPEVENLTGKLVVVLAGYQRQMEAFFAHNPGLPSRFPHELKFNDYSDSELLQILRHKIDKKYKGRMKAEDGLSGLYCRIVARRIGQGRGKEGFGNARTVENKFDWITARQADRIKKEKRAAHPIDYMLLTKEDLIGPEPSAALKTCLAYQKLQSLIGLKAVKESCQTLFTSIKYNYDRELEEKPLLQFSLNRVFLGSPGTGKTTVAKLYGQILAHLGLLSNGEVIVKNPADFIGSVIGESEKNTKGILAATVGKVLVIDEFYGLYGGRKGDGGGMSGGADSYKISVIDTIVAEVQSTPGDDRCVLLLGYKEEMENMFQNVNPGLTRRFPLDSAFVFEDFTDDELHLILDLKLQEQGYTASDQGKKTAMEILARARNRPHFGNAGEVDILLNAAKLRHQKRLTAEKLSSDSATLEGHDFDEDFDRGKKAETNILKLFEGVIGCEALVKRLEGYQATVENMKKLDMDPREQIPFNFLFRGPPGTGKTTTARKVGQVYYDMGLLATVEVVECSATDFVGQYIGQTGPKTLKMLENALGKVILIDEAYRLAAGHFAQEAMDEIVDAITKPKFFRKLIIILAGYDEDINRLMSINPGLTSRFPETISFRCLTPDESIALLTQSLRHQKEKLAGKMVELNIDVLELPRNAFRKDLGNRFLTLSRSPSWANARDIQTLARGVFDMIIKSPELASGKLIVSEKAILSEVDAMISERAHRGNVQELQNHNHSVDEPRTAADHGSSSAPVVGTQGSTSTTPGNSQDSPANESDESRPSSIAGDPPPDAVQEKTIRDTGISDEIWNRLQEDRLAADTRQREYEQLLEKEASLMQTVTQVHENEMNATAGIVSATERADDDAKRLHEEARLRHELERRALEAMADKLRQERKAKEEAQRKEHEAQMKLREMGLCIAGFRWIKQEHGYRCAGGSHFVSNADLG